MEKNFKHRSELDKILARHGINKEDICLVGSMALKVHGIREHGDIDFCALDHMVPSLRKNMNGNYLSDNVNLVVGKYERLLGIRDEELIRNPLYHERVDGFKVIKLEVEFSAKVRRSWDKDLPDIRRIEKYAMASKTWDWNLVFVREDDIAADGPRISPGRLLELFWKALRDPARAVRKVRERMPAWLKRTPRPSSSLAGQVIQKIPTAALLGRQFVGGEFSRYDIFLRYLAVKSIDRGDGKFEKVYGEMQELRQGKTAHQDITALVESMKRRGYLSRYPVPVSRDGHILDGSHRLACALYLDIWEVPIEIQPERRTVDFGRRWFVQRGFDGVLIAEMDKVRDELFERHGVWFSVILWPPVKEWFDEISAKIRGRFTVRWEKDLNLGSSFPDFARRIYAIDDIDRWKVERKLHAMKSYEPEVHLMALEIPEPRFRIKKRTCAYLSDEGASLKKWIRNSYRRRVPDYIYDIVCHTGDNHEHNRESFRIINEYLPRETLSRTRPDSRGKGTADET